MKLTVIIHTTSQFPAIYRASVRYLESVITKTRNGTGQARDMSRPVPGFSNNLWNLTIAYGP